MKKESYIFETPFFIICTILIFSFCISSFNAKSFELNKNIKDSYSYIISLEFQKARDILDSERISHADNGLIYLQDNYIDFLTLIIGEDFNYFNQQSDLKKERLELLKKCDKGSPYYLYSQAEIHLQWAFARIKFQDYFNSAYEIQRAYYLLRKNHELFPDFYLNKKSLGLLYCLLGSVPENYQWIVQLSGMKADVKTGLFELNSFLEISKRDLEYNIYYTETLFLLSFLNINIVDDKAVCDDLLEEIGDKYVHSPLLRFAAAVLSDFLAKNDQVIHILSSNSSENQEFPLYYLDYLLGVAKLQSLDFTASDHFHNFLNSFKGHSYIKSSYQKLAWISFLQEDYKKMRYYFEKLLIHGKTFLDEDKKAQRDTENNKIPNALLLRARLLYDGGYYNKAMQELEIIGEPLYFPNIESIIEYWYRKARILQALDTDEEQTQFCFLKALKKGEGIRGSYFAPMSALQLGFHYEKNEEEEEAIRYYKKCLNMSNFDYQTGIHRRARMGINRLEN